MKRAVAACLLVLVVLQSIGFMGFFCLQQQLIHTAMQEALRCDAPGMETLLLRPAEYTAARVEEHELYYRGEMYDIQSAERQGDLLVVRALRDHMEASLFRAFRRVLHHSRDQHGRLAAGVLLLSFVNYVTSVTVLPAPAELLLGDGFSMLSAAGYTTIARPVNVPPPDQFFAG